MSESQSIEGGADYVQGVGGRLSAPKSEGYRQVVTRIESRANPFVARFMLASDIAYVLAAIEVGATPPEDGEALLRCLLDLLPRADQLAASPAAGDIVVQREAWVFEKVGLTVGSRLHTGRNRGESVRTILPRLFFRDVVHREKKALLRLIRALHTQAGPVREALAPVFHHLQHAGYTTVGEYLLAWATNLLPHIDRLDQADERLSIAPPPQTGRREGVEIAQSVGRRLGFARVSILRQETHVTEDQFSDPFFALVSTAAALARMSEDLRIWMTTEFDFFELADAHASGSSVLPQKKNPFGLQTVIGTAQVSAGRLAAQITSSLAPCEELDSVFNIGSLFQQAHDIVGVTEFMAEVMEQGRFKLDELKRKATIGYAGASEALDILIFEAGVPMRVAHHELGAAVRAALAGKPIPDVGANIAAALGRPVNVDAARLLAVVKGEVVPDTALNLPAVNAAWTRIAGEIGTLADRIGGDGPVDIAIAALVAEAGRWLAARAKAAP
jgi:argininosuccinate lyase